MGSVSVSHPLGCTMEHQTAISDDRHIPGIKAVADEVHQYGAKLSLQIHSGGLVAMEDMLAGRPVWTPSIPVPKPGDMMDGFLEEELAMAPFGRIAEVDFQILSAADIRTAGRHVRRRRRSRQAGRAPTASSCMAATAISSPPSSRPPATAAPTRTAGRSKTAPGC